MAGAAAMSPRVKHEHPVAVSRQHDCLTEHCYTSRSRTGEQDHGGTVGGRHVPAGQPDSVPCAEGNILRGEPMSAWHHRPEESSGSVRDVHRRGQRVSTKAKSNRATGATSSRHQPGRARASIAAPHPSNHRPVTRHIMPATVRTETPTLAR
jgi:hypothetical protein